MSTTDSASNMSRLTQSTRWATIATFCFGYFFVAVVVAHLIRPDLSLTTNFISEYVLGANGFVMTSALFVFGIGVLTFTAGLRQSLAATTYARIGLVLLVIGGIAMLFVGVFPVEVQTTAEYLTRSGPIHDLAALIFFASTVAGIVLLSFGFRHDGQWHRHARSEVILAMLALVAFVAFFAIYPLQAGDAASVPELAKIIGLVQRMLTLSVWLWLFVTALRLRALQLQTIQSRP
jgi:hypothetical membrane protein